MYRKTKKKIALLYPAFNGGGGEAVCFWMLEALKEEYELTLFTLTPNDFRVFDNIYGTHLSGIDIQVFCPIPKFLVFIFRYIFFRLKSFRPQRQHVLMRYFKGIEQGFDLSISAYNEMDLGQPGIQYFHDMPGSAIGKERLQRFSQFSETRMKKNITIAPSQWMAEIIKKGYGIDTRVIYPPAGSNFSHISWENREDGFVCIARLSPEKRIEMAIKILKMVRAYGYDVHIHILTTGGKRGYQKYIQRLQKENNSWVFLEKGLSRRDFCQIIAKHKYGINVKEYESFGIGIAEMVNAGCIPFFTATGGQVEILGSNEWLMFSDLDEAVEKVVTVLSNKEMQEQVRSFLIKKPKLFTQERFKAEIQGVVREFFKRQGSD